MQLPVISQVYKEYRNINNSGKIIQKLWSAGHLSYEVGFKNKAT